MGQRDDRDHHREAEEQQAERPLVGEVEARGDRRGTGGSIVAGIRPPYPARPLSDAPRSPARRRASGCELRASRPGLRPSLRAGGGGEAPSAWSRPRAGRLDAQIRPGRAHLHSRAAIGRRRGDRSGPEPSRRGPAHRAQARPPGSWSRTLTASRVQSPVSARRARRQEAGPTPRPPLVAGAVRVGEADVEVVVVVRPPHDHPGGPWRSRLGPIRTRLAPCGDEAVHDGLGGGAVVGARGPTCCLGRRRPAPGGCQRRGRSGARRGRRPAR